MNGWNGWYGKVKRVELFARERRPGWTSWGNELPPIKKASLRAA